MFDQGKAEKEIFVVLAEQQQRQHCSFDVQCTSKSNRNHKNKLETKWIY